MEARRRQGISFPTPFSCLDEIAEVIPRLDDEMRRTWGRLIPSFSCNGDGVVFRFPCLSVGPKSRQSWGE
jgi:hypothetical protein